MYLKANDESTSYFCCAPRLRDLSIADLLKVAHPSLKRYESLEVKSEAGPDASLRVMFMGVSTILFDDGKSAIMIDGFFSRPGLLTCLLGKVEPNQVRITYALKRAGVTRLAAVLTAHSHHDHAMDSPEVARRTGARLVGSESTANIARGVNFAEDRIRVIKGGETLSFDGFTITAIKSPHSPGGLLMGHIKAPLRPPVRVREYREGGNYSYSIKHGDRRILIHPSANYLPGVLKTIQADVIFISIGTLGKQSDEFAKEYWREVVQATGAKVVIPIHWDNFMRPLNKPLKPMPRLFDDFERGMKTVLLLAEAGNVAVRLMPPFRSVDMSELYR